MSSQSHSSSAAPRCAVVTPLFGADPQHALRGLVPDQHRPPAPMRRIAQTRDTSCAGLHELRDQVQHICLDAGESDPATVLALIDHLESGAPPEMRYLIELRLRVRSFHPALPLALRRSRRVIARALLPVESLNRDTLEHLHTGHAPLEAVQAVKAMQDCGQLVSSDYVLDFPLESPESVAQEAALLARLVHLFMPPRVSLSGVFHHDRIDIGRATQDLWLRETFGMDTPCPIWSQARSRRWRWSALHGALRGLGTGAAYRKREAVFRHLEAVKEDYVRSRGALAQPKSLWNRLWDREDELREPPLSRLFVDDGNLVKGYHLPGHEDTWWIRLDARELDVLRYLYWQRQRRHLDQRFGRDMSAAELDAIVIRHLRFGSVVESQGWLLCVANDPGYWQGQEAALTLPASPASSSPDRWSAPDACPPRPSAAAPAPPPP